MIKRGFHSEKKGQIFLIAAIIFVLAIYTVVIPYNTLKTYPGLEDYKDLTENYQIEFPKVFNWAVYEGEEVGPALSNFNTAFLGQARQTDPNFGVLYLYKDPEGIHIVNTLNNKVLNVRLTNINSEDLNIFIPPPEAVSDGQICIEGVTCTTTGVSLSEFGSGYDNTENLEGVTMLCFDWTPDIEGDEYCPSLEDFSSISVTESRELAPATGGIGQTIQVSVNQY